MYMKVAYRHSVKMYMKAAYHQSMVIPLILKISLGEIKGKMDELLINLNIKTKFDLGRGE
jgi:hypothetical protein